MSTCLSKNSSLPHILFLLTQSLESPGGGGRFFPIAKALTNKGFPVTLIALHHDYKNLRQKQFIKDGVNVKYVGQMHVHKSANGKTYFKPWQLIWITAISTIRLTLAALQTPVDIVQICKPQPMNGLAAWVVHVLKAKPVFLDSDDLEAINNRFSGHWQQKIVAWFENWIPSFIKGLTVNTRYIANHYTQLGFPNDQIHFVPNGVDRERFEIVNHSDVDQRTTEIRQSLQLDSNIPLVLYVGSISLVSHAIDLLLEAFVLVKEEVQNAKLLVVGAGEDLDGLKALAHQLGIIDSVIFTGRIAMEKIPYYFCTGNVSVDPLRNTIAAESSFSLKLVESLASGIPCVTTDIGDRKETIEGGGIAVKPDNAQALASGISKILTNNELANEMKQESVKIREKIWWDTKVTTFINLYSTAINKNAPTP